MSGGPGPRWAWRDSDVVVVGITALLGVIAIAAAWFGVSGTGSPTTQSVWLNVGLAGLLVSSAGFSIWFMRGRAAIGARRVSLVSLEPVEPEPVVSRPQPHPRKRGGTAPIQAVQVPGTRHVHDPACPLVEGKRVEPVAPGAGEPCGLCRP